MTSTNACIHTHNRQDNEESWRLLLELARFPQVVVVEVVEGVGVAVCVHMRFQRAVLPLLNTQDIVTTISICLLIHTVCVCLCLFHIR
jgi:hypothetical protein